MIICNLLILKNINVLISNYKYYLKIAILSLYIVLFSNYYIIFLITFFLFFLILILILIFLVFSFLFLYVFFFFFCLSHLYHHYYYHYHHHPPHYFRHHCSDHKREFYNFPNFSFVELPYLGSKVVPQLVYCTHFFPLFELI